MIRILLLAINLSLFALGDTSHMEPNPSTRSSSSSCRQTLTREEEFQVLKYVNDLRDCENAKSPEQFLATLNPSDSLEREAELKAHIAFNHQLISYQTVLPILEKVGAGTPASDSDKALLEKAGVPKARVDEYVSHFAAQFKPYFDSLRQVGIKLSHETGWDFSESSLTIEKIKTTPSLRTALSLFLSPTITASLENPERRESLVLGNQVLLPPCQDGCNTGIGVIRGFSHEQYQRNIQFHLNNFSQNTQAFLANAKEAASYSGMMEGRLRGSRGYGGKTPAEIDRDNAYSGVLKDIKVLRSLGVNKELLSQLHQVESTLLTIDNANQAEAMQKLNAAFWAAVAAPFVPAVISAAPVIGAFLGMNPATYSTGVLATGSAVNGLTTASAVLGIMPLAFAAGSSVVSAGISTSRGNGNFFCNLYDSFVQNGSQALLTAPFMAALPSAASIAGTLGPTAAGFFNFGTATAFLGLGVKAGVVGMSECYDRIKKAEAGKGLGDEALQREMTTQAIQLCTQAGVDLTFAIVAARQVSRSTPWRAQTKEAPTKSGNGGVQNSSLEVTTATGQKGGKPGGTEPKIRSKGDPDVARSDRREIQSAEILAYEKYKVEYLGGKRSGQKNPDYLIEGKTFDNYAPKENTTARQIGDTIARKVESMQTERIVLNLNDSTVSLHLIQTQLKVLSETPGNGIQRLKEIIVIKNGQVFHMTPPF